MKLREISVQIKFKFVSLISKITRSKNFNNKTKRSKNFNNKTKRSKNFSKKTKRIKFFCNKAKRRKRLQKILGIKITIFLTKDNLNYLLNNIRIGKHYNRKQKLNIQDVDKR